jgi:hypothetical protein
MNFSNKKKISYTFSKTVLEFDQAYVNLGKFNINCAGILFD